MKDRRNMLLELTSHLRGFGLCPIVGARRQKTGE
jgi:hypothetical protein